MLGDDLAAGSAGGGSAGAGDGEGGKVGVVVSDGLEDGDALGAASEAVTCALDIRAGDDGAVGSLQGCADLEFAERRVGARAGGEGGLDEFGVVSHGVLQFR